MKVTEVAGMRVALLCAAIGLAFAPAPGFAAEGELEEVVVTAQKREESLQEVPIAVTAFTADEFEKARTVSLEGLQAAVPNVQIAHFANTPHNAVFSIRGAGGIIEPDPYAGTTVSVVVDGIPQHFNMVALMDLFDIERIEVLKGPQGTLFGANTTGGVINIVTKQPTGEFGGDVMITAGNYDRRDVNLAVDFPLIEDRLFGKITAMSHNMDGFYTNVYDGESMGDKDTTAVRAYLKLVGDDGFDATLQYEHVDSNNGSPSIVNGSLPGELFYVAPGVVYGNSVHPMYESPCQPGQRCKAPSKYWSGNAQVPDVSNFTSKAPTLTINWSMDWGDVTSITGYKDFRLHEYSDQDYAPVDLHRTDRETNGQQFSQELRAHIDVSEDFELLVGAFYFAAEWDHYQDYILEGLAAGFTQLTNMDWENWSGSLFAQGYYHVNERLRLQVGVRYSHEKTESEVGINNFLNIDPTTFEIGVAQYANNGTTQFIGGLLNEGDGLFGDGSQDLDFVSDSKSWDDIGAKVGLDYQIADGVMAYGYYARGFKSGGFVGRIVVPSDLGPYNPEYIDSFEVGVKGDFADRRLRVNLAAFHNTIDDLQIANIYRTTDAQGNNVNGNSILNAAKAKAWGVELEFQALLADNVTLNGSLAHLDATYDDFPFVDPNFVATGGINQLKGERLQNAPKWTATAGVTADFQVGEGLMTASVRYRYNSSKYYTNVLNTARSQIQPIHFVDANLDWSPASERWSIGAWAKNLFDERYVSVAFDSPGALALVGYHNPREYGVSFKYHF